MNEAIGGLALPDKEIRQTNSGELAGLPQRWSGGFPSLDARTTDAEAARMALARGAEGPVRMGDFLDALELESGGRWSRDTDCCVGFKRGN